MVLLLVGRLDEAVEIRSSGMGYVVSAFGRVDAPERTVRIDDLLHYDPGIDVTVSFFTNGVEIGSLFAAAPRERFDLELERARRADPRSRGGQVAEI